MTLSVLWRSEGRLHLASDSRISFGPAGFADVGIKVMRLPIRVMGTGMDERGGFEILFEQTYGFCYAGNMSNAATFKQLVEDLLVDVQYLPANDPLTFNDLCQFFCRFCGMVSSEIMSKLAEKGGYTFFVAGLCPQSGKLHGARFSLTQNSGRTVVTFDEVAQAEGEYVALGSGAERFDTLFDGQCAQTLKVLSTLNAVIDDATVDSVGGDIQYGSFDGGGRFQVSGVVRISVEEAFEDGRQYGPTARRSWRYRGFDIYDEWKIPGEKFWPSPGFIELKVPSNCDSKWKFIEFCRKTLES